MVLKPSKNLGVKLEVCILTLTYITKEGHSLLNRGSTYGLEGSEEGISDDLGAGGGAEEANSLVLGGLGAESPLVDVLEHLIEAELSEALSGISDEGGVPADGEALKALSPVDGLESIGDALVEGGVSLNSP
jgi:hypothetical protein